MTSTIEEFKNTGFCDDIFTTNVQKGFLWNNSNLIECVSVCLFGVSKFYPDLLEIELDSIAQIISFSPLKFENQKAIVRK